MATAPYDYEQVEPETIYPPSAAFSWPHGLLNAIRLVCTFSNHNYENFNRFSWLPYSFADFSHSLFQFWPFPNFPIFHLTEFPPMHPITFSYSYFLAYPLLSPSTPMFITFKRAHFGPL